MDLCPLRLLASLAVVSLGAHQKGGHWPWGSRDSCDSSYGGSSSCPKFQSWDGFLYSMAGCHSFPFTPPALTVAS